MWLASFGVEWLYQALEQYEYITIRNVAIKMFCIVLMFVLIREQKDYVMYGAIVVLAGYGSNIFNIIRIRKMVDLRIHTRIDIFRHFKPMLMFLLQRLHRACMSKRILLCWVSRNNQHGWHLSTCDKN